jgi:calcium/calmodulin-dependent protein kinase I
MWALGVVTYCILGGYPPFEGGDVDELFDNVVKGNYQFHDDFWSEVSDEAKDFIRGLLNIQAETRMTAEAALRHPWVSQ